MKYIKSLLVVISLLTLTFSCTKRDFTPEVGNTKVQFATERIDITLNGDFHYVPVQMVEQATTSATAEIELVSAKAVIDGQEIDLVEREKNDTLAADIIFTSKKIYIAPYDSVKHGVNGLPEANFEFRLPNYKQYESISISFKLVGDNVVAEKSTLSYNAEKAAGGTIEGAYALTCSIWPDSGPIDVKITKVSDELYRFGYFDPDNGDVDCTVDGSTIYLSTSQFITYEGTDLYYRGCDGSSILDQAVAITVDAGGFTLDNGMFFGDLSTGQGYVIAVPGDRATRK